jgi:peptidoglycan/LPS O-acetylase OafA/YrhL
VRERFPLFDSLRAIAALSVLVTHCSGLTGFNSDNPLGAITARLNVGVTIFFVISGFLLYRPFVAARLEGRPAPSPLGYARRRALRIVPAYWVALTALALILPKYVAGPLDADWWAYYGFLSNWNSIWVVTGIAPAWSLCVEVAFYVALPLLALAAARGYGGRSRERQVRLELIALASSAALALLGRALVFHHDPSTLFPTSLPGNWTWFAAGMSLAVLSAGHAGRAVSELPAPLRFVALHPGWTWVGAGAVMLLTASPLIGLPRTFDYRYSNLAFQAEHLLYVTFAVLVVAPAVFQGDGRGWPRRVLAQRELGRLGVVSYGIFLYHLPLILAFQHVADRPGGFLWLTLVTFAGATAAGTASYAIVENPLMPYKHGWHGGRGRAAAAAAPGPVR